MLLRRLIFNSIICNILSFYFITFDTPSILFLLFRNIECCSWRINLMLSAKIFPLSLYPFKFRIATPNSHSTDSYHYKKSFCIRLPFMFGFTERSAFLLILTKLQQHLTENKIKVQYRTAPVFKFAHACLTIGWGFQDRYCYGCWILLMLQKYLNRLKAQIQMHKVKSQWTLQNNTLHSVPASRYSGATKHHWIEQDYD